MNEYYYNVYCVSGANGKEIKLPIALHLKSKTIAISFLLNNYYIDFDISKRQEIYAYRYDESVKKHVGTLCYLRKYKNDIMTVSKTSKITCLNQLYQLPLQIQKQSILYPFDTLFFSKKYQLVIDPKDAPEYEDILFEKKVFQL